MQSQTLNNFSHKDCICMFTSTFVFIEQKIETNEITEFIDSMVEMLESNLFPSGEW